MDSELQLIKQLQNSNTKSKAFNTLVELYKERLYWHIRHIVKSHDDSDDVLQNTFVKVFRNINKFKGDSKLYSWMYRIATNEALSFLNKKNKFKFISSEEYKEFMLNKLTEDIYFDGESIHLNLQKAILELPDKQQLVFNMKYFQEMKYKEISEILETTEGALKASYHHAVKKIEIFMKQKLNH